MKQACRISILAKKVKFVANNCHVMSYLKISELPRSKTKDLWGVLPWCSLDCNVRRHILILWLIVTHVWEGWHTSRYWGLEYYQPSSTICAHKQQQLQHLLWNDIIQNDKYSRNNGQQELSTTEQPTFAVFVSQFLLTRFSHRKY